MKLVNDVEFEGILDDFAQSDESLSEIDELKRKLYFDAVLGCQNRTKFEEDSKDLEKPYTYFTLDANNLKFCNDKFSHEAGDTLLKVTAQIGMQIWGIDNFYRTGGDEFAVLIKGVDQDTSISSEQLTKFKQLIAEEDKKYEFPIAVSVGFATSKDAETLETVINLADEMMYADKKVYKEAYPEYDMRKARLTSDTLKEALKSGDFSKAYRDLKAERGEAEAPKKEVSFVDDFTFNGVAKVKPVQEDTKADNDLNITVQDSFSEVVDEESLYETNEFNNKIQPILKETTDKAVKEAVKSHNDKLKTEVAKVLNDEVSHRLSNYEKKRRRRNFWEKTSSIVKGVVILLIVLSILGNQRLRSKITLIFRDAKEIVTDLASGKEASSNKLVYDLFKDLDEYLDEVNTEEFEGFSIEDDESTEASEEVTDID